MKQLQNAHPRCKGFFSAPDGLVGLRNKGHIYWYRWSPGGYHLTGTTRNPGPGTTFHRFDKEIFDLHRETLEEDARDIQLESEKGAKR